jgi:hypothetical protein
MQRIECVPLRLRVARRSITEPIDQRGVQCDDPRICAAANSNVAQVERYVRVGYGEEFDRSAIIVVARSGDGVPEVSSNGV